MEIVGVEDSETTTESSLDVPGESNMEISTEQDFATFSAEQLEEVAHIEARIAKRLARRPSRRRKPSRRHGVVDFRRSTRANLMQGEIIELRRRTRRRRKVRLVLRCLRFDGSLQPFFVTISLFTAKCIRTRRNVHIRDPIDAGIRPIARLVVQERA